MSAVLQYHPAPWSVAVVVPACNEATTIASCIHAIVASVQSCALASAWIVIVADGCTDDTIAVAVRALGANGEVIACEVNSAGMARQIGVAAALKHYHRVHRTQLWLANTDADTVVPTDWLVHHLRLADRGMAAVAGVVAVESIPGYDYPTLQRLMQDYRVADDDTHSHVHGANFGVRADAYLDAGGWGDLALAEDHCLWQRLRGRGWPLSSCARSTVVTSGRLHGRARGGFADTLKAKLNTL